MQSHEDHLISIFSYHVPDAIGGAVMDSIRSKCLELALFLEGAVPESREKSLAFTHLQSVMMFANSGVVQSYPIKGA